jgi:hypothetical protein
MDTITLDMVGLHCIWLDALYYSPPRLPFTGFAAGPRLCIAGGVANLLCAHRASRGEQSRSFGLWLHCGPTPSLRGHAPVNLHTPAQSRTQ